MRFLKFLYTLPVLPILIGYELHVIYMIVKETDPDQLMDIETEGELKNIPNLTWMILEKNTQDLYIYSRYYHG